MKLYQYKIIIILCILFFAGSISFTDKFVLALESESLNDDSPWDSSKEFKDTTPSESSKALKDTTPSESLNDEADAKSSCPPPYVKLVSPQAAAAGATVSIQGARFGDDTGRVIFFNGISASIISWSSEKISVTVPDGAKSGNITVIRTCLTPNKKGAGSYFKVIEKEK